MWWIGPIKRELVCGGKIRDIVCALRWNVVNKLQISWPQKSANKCQKISIPSDLESVSKLSGDGRSNYFIWVSCLYLLRRDRNGFYDCHTKSPTRVCRKSILKISQNFNTTGDLKPQKRSPSARHCLIFNKERRSRHSAKRLEECA